jgi:lipid A 3-O-deacylase
VRKLFSVVATLVLVTTALSVRAADPRGPLITVIEENDDFALNGDQHYTQGLKLSYLYGDEQLPNWAYALAHNIPDLGMSIETPRFGYTVGQSIYTPRNIRSPVALTYDRPYAGWLYFGMILQRQGKQGGIPVNDNFEVDLGFIGPESFAAQAQAWWHTVGGWVVPKGWGNQLNTEPAIDIKYSRQWKFSTVSQGVGLELIPNAGFSLGNVMTYAGAGALVRFGYNIPDDFGPQTIDSLAQPTGTPRRTHPFGWYLFTAANGRAVLHNAFLDGNLYQPSPHVAKEPLVADFQAGIVLVFRRFDIAGSFVQRTREYKTQPRADRFGSISINASF